MSAGTRVIDGSNEDLRVRKLAMPADNDNAMPAAIAS